MDDIVRDLGETNNQDVNLDGHVLIVDTLKKMASVNDKVSVKELFKLFRSLTGKGMTIILLGHTNKYGDDDGMPVFEGVGDNRADVDELIYLIPDKQPDGTTLVSTLPDKVRGAFNKITYVINRDRSVSRADDYVDLVIVKKRKQQREKDESTIEAAFEAMDAGCIKQVQITDFCKSKYTLGEKRVRDVLRRYDTELWNSRQAMEKNAILWYRGDAPF